MPKDFFRRFWTAICAVAILLFIGFAADEKLFSLLILIFLLFAGGEWAALTRLPRHYRIAYSPLTSSLFFAFFYDHDTPVVATLQFLILCASCFFWIIIVPMLLLRGQPKTLPAMHPLVSMILGWALLLSFWSALTTLYLKSVWMLLELIVYIISIDSFAYIVGSIGGKRHLCPDISPNKTWEGLLGGWTALMIIGGLSRILGWSSELFQLPIGQYWLTLNLIFILALWGDLSESFLKRSAGLKDSGVFLPGHGGIFDRVDAWFPVMSFFACQSIGL